MRATMRATPKRPPQAVAGGKEALQTEAAQGPQDGGDMTMGTTALQLEGLAQVGDDVTSL